MSYPSYNTIPFKCPSTDPNYSPSTETRCISGYTCNAWGYCERVCGTTCDQFQYCDTDGVCKSRLCDACEDSQYCEKGVCKEKCACLAENESGY